jgi:hypothetical protein
MTELVTQTRAASKRDKVRSVADDIVTANSLATHLSMTRQNVARLTAEAVIEQRSDAVTIRLHRGCATSSTCARSISGRRARKPTPITPGPRPKRFNSSWLRSGPSLCGYTRSTR